MPNLDIFKQDAFSMHSLTSAINKVPFVPGRIGGMGLFTPIPVSTTSVDIEERGGVLKLLQTKERGEVGTVASANKRKMRTLKVPHIPHPATIKADSIQNIRSFGSETELETVQSVVNQKLTEMSWNHDATLEHLMAGAIKGVILDADLTTIYDLFSEFGVSQLTEIDFDLDNASPAAGALRKKCHDVVRKIEDEIGGLPYEHIHCLCSSQFFDDLVAHKEVAAAYERLAEGELLRTGLVRKIITIFGITFEEYRGKVGATSFIADDKAHLFPVGVPGLFQVYYAPADYMETVNTLGRPRYAKIALDEKFQKYVEIDTQSNPLPICTIPRTLVKVKRT